MKAIRRVIILGAQSAIAEACARRFAAEGARLVIVGRDIGRLKEIAADLATRGADQVDVASVDLQTERTPERALQAWSDHMQGVTHVLIAHGALGIQAQAEGDADEARRILDVNFNSAALWALAAANLMERQRSGTLIAIGSVAGDRGRRSNYVYGAAKGGLQVLMQGIAHRLAQANARAVLVKPGFVDTPMTAGLVKAGPMWAKPEAIADVILRAADGRGGPIVYAPWRWRWILLVIRALPPGVMHKTKL